MSRIIRGAPLDLQQVRQESFEAGRAQGLEEGKAQAAALLAQAQEQRRHAQEAQLEEALSLATALAARIIGEAARDPAVTARVVAQSLAQAESSRPRVRLHPGALDAARAALGAACELVPDPSLAPGGCIVETEWGQLDARVEVALRALADALRYPAKPGP